MISKSSLIHLRFGFSFFLLPVYLFALAVSPNFTESSLLISFLVLHFLLYPASNGFNSYFDRDTSSIGLVKNPPPVKLDLYYLSLILDLSAILVGLLISWSFALMLFIYGLVSKAYSHPSIRLKKYPIVSWLVAGFFQGFFAFITAYIGINAFPIETIFRSEVFIPAGLTSLLLWGSYPMTQIYQHEEDLKRGDLTLSAKLGVMGTFYFTTVFFAFAAIAMAWYFKTHFSIVSMYYFFMAIFPTTAFFLWWFLKVKSDRLKANYSNTMILNYFSAAGFNIFFIYLFLDHTHVLQAIGGGY